MYTFQLKKLNTLPSWCLAFILFFSRVYFYAFEYPSRDFFFPYSNLVASLRNCSWGF